MVSHKRHAFAVIVLCYVMGPALGRGDHCLRTRCRDQAGKAALLEVDEDWWEIVRGAGEGCRGFEAVASEIGRAVARGRGENEKWGFQAGKGLMVVLSTVHVACTCEGRGNTTT